MQVLIHRVNQGDAIGYLEMSNHAVIDLSEDAEEEMGALGDCLYSVTVLRCRNRCLSL